MVTKYWHVDLLDVGVTNFHSKNFHKIIVLKVIDLEIRVCSLLMSMGTGIVIMFY